MVYDGRFVLKSVLQHNPSTDFVINDPIEVRFGNKGKTLFLKRPDGKEVKTYIVKQTRIVNNKKHN